MKTNFALGCLFLFSSPLFGATLIHHYTFDTSVQDLVGSANGSLVGDATVTGGKLVLDGSGDYAQFSQYLVPPTGFTVAFFTQQTAPQPGLYFELISQGSSGLPGFYLGSSPSGIMRAGDSWGSTGVTFPTDGLPHHIALASDASNTFLYLDGVLVNQLGSTVFFPNAADFTRLGAQFSNHGEYFYGTLDDVRIYNGTLTGGEVAAIALVPEPSSYAMLVGLAVVAGLLGRRGRKQG